MRKLNRKRSIVSALVLALVVTAGWVAPSMAQEAPPPIAVELLTQRAKFTDDVAAQIKVKLDGGATQAINVKDASPTVVAKITVQPEAQFPWHTHPGPVVANVAQGELIYVNADDCVERPYPAGTAFVDPGRGNVHTAFNPTAGETVVFATFFEVPGTGSLTITEGVEPPTNCELDI